MNMEEEKKGMSGLKKAILAFVGVIVAFIGTIAAGMALLMRRSVKKLKGKETANNKVECIGLGTGSTACDAQTDNAILSCLIGCMNVFWTENPTKDVNLDLCGIMSMISVTVPVNVTVRCEIDAIASMVSSNVEDIDDADAPVLNITGKARGSMISIKRAESAAEVVSEAVDTAVTESAEEAQNSPTDL